MLTKKSTNKCLNFFEQAHQPKHQSLTSLKATFRSLRHFDSIFPPTIARALIQPKS